MPRTIRFHLGENCHRAIAEAPYVTTTPEAGLLNATDEQQLDFCRADTGVLFTQDHDFLGIHAAGMAPFGIVYCGKGTRSIGEIIQGLVLIWEIMEPAAMVGRVEFL